MRSPIQPAAYAARLAGRWGLPSNRNLLVMQAGSRYDAIAEVLRGGNDVYPGFKYETDVDADGTVTLKLPLPPGTRVEIVVLAPEVDGFSDLVDASISSTEFWNNPWDDEDWNPPACIHLTVCLSE